MTYSRRKKPTKSELLADRTAVWPEDDLCPLCHREMKRGKSVDEHHLVPRMYGGTKKFFVHRVCHTKIHSVFSEAELAQIYNTFELLRAQPEIRAFIRWIRKHDPDFTTKHRRPNARL